VRILATNPDTIGDLVLRQPLYAALQEAGHELMLVVRPLLEPLVSLLAPGAQVAICHLNVYDPTLATGDAALEPIVTAARRFDPEMLLVAPYQWTTLEERLALELPAARRLAMSGQRFADPHYGPARPSRLAPCQVVEVAEEVAEVRKNELLAGAVLGRGVRLGDPELQPAAEHLLAGEAQLARLGLSPGEYWVACIGHTQSTGVRNWRPERWAQVLAAWAARRRRRFLLIGHASEAGICEEIRGQMGSHADAAVSWSGRGDGDLDVLLGLIARSSGYVGRDTGPMHLAAAMGKPVLAVFGGGTWPRFLPSGPASVAITVGVPCAGCNWKCHLPESYCIGEVPADEVLKAAEELESGQVTGRSVRVLPPGGELLSRIGREGAIAARQRLTELSVKRRQVMEQTQAAERSIREELEAVRAEASRRESILRNRLAAAENLFRTREAEMQKRLEEFESGRALPESLQKRVTQVEAEWADKLAAVQEHSRGLHEQYLQAQGEAADLRLRLERALTDQQALLSLTRQQEQQIATLHQRLHDLVASRWRRYGQRLRLCMTMPWEAQYQNGQH
jgi:ADP-heptose:LPS heptosyltransferase